MLAVMSVSSRVTGSCSPLEKTLFSTSTALTRIMIETNFLFVFFGVNREQTLKEIENVLLIEISRTIIENDPYNF
jgi:hypothetical protein